MDSPEPFQEILRRHPEGVILLEGRRAISEESKRSARRFASALASLYPRATFRSGNAEGADAAFAEGVVGVDPSRMELVVPFARHRLAARAPGGAVFSLEDVGADWEEEIAAASIGASPENHRLIRLRHHKGPLGAKGLYLMRDTLKVMGLPPAYPKPVAAFFIVDPDDPDAGGTGHTIRVCRRLGVPVFLQAAWTKWFATQ